MFQINWSYIACALTPLLSRSTRFYKNCQFFIGEQLSLEFYQGYFCPCMNLKSYRIQLHFLGHRDYILVCRMSSLTWKCHQDSVNHLHNLILMEESYLVHKIGHNTIWSLQICILEWQLEQDYLYLAEKQNLVDFIWTLLGSSQVTSLCEEIKWGTYNSG